MSNESKADRLALYKREDVRRAITRLMDQGGEIRPQRDPVTGDYVLSGVETFGIPDASLLFEELERHSIVEKYQISSVPSCPKCEHSSFSVDYVCPFSQHRNLQQGTMIVHYDCSHTDSEARFKSGDELVCPKCGRKLKLLGVDYHRTDRVYYCSGCGRYFGMPTIELRCNTCGKVSWIDQTRMIPVFAYRINERLRSELAAYCSLETPLLNLFKRLGYDVSTPKALKGLSGVEHTIDIYASKEGSQIAVDILSGIRDVSAEAVAGFFAKTYDAKPARAILVAVPKLSQEGQRLATLYGLETVEGENSDQVVENLGTLLRART